MKRIRFVTDSTSDLPPEWAEKYHVSVIPVFINYNNNSYADDGKELIREKYYQELPSIRPFATTSAMSPGLAEEYILNALKDADHLILLTLPATLSGVYNAVRLAAQKLPPEKYTLIDSGNTTMGLGWQIMVGMEVAEKTGGDVDAVVAALKRARDSSYVYCVLDTLEYLRRSGRVGWAAASLGALLQIKPMIQVYNGEVNNIGKTRTFKRALADLAERVRSHAPIDRLAILHSNNLEGAREIADLLKEYVTSDTPTIFITPGLGTNIGPGGVGVALVTQSWRNESDHAIGTRNAG